MWNFQINNNKIDSKSRFRIHKQHLERLIQTKTGIDDKGMLTPNFLYYNLSKNKVKKDNIKKINYENSIIYNRMLSIAEKNSPYSLIETHPIYCPAFDKKRFNFDKKVKKIQIEKLNKYYYSRFISVKPYYSTKNILKQNDFYRYLEKGMKRVDLINPNLSFVSFDKFKNNIAKEIKIMNMKKSHSTQNIFTYNRFNTNNYIEKNNNNLTLKNFKKSNSVWNNSITTTSKSSYFNPTKFSNRAKSASIDLRKKNL